MCTIRYFTASNWTKKKYNSFMRKLKSVYKPLNSRDVTDRLYIKNKKLIYAENYV